MFEKIPAPVKGQPVRASWGAGLTNRVNELGAMVPARGLARDGLTGTGFAALPSNRRERSGKTLPPWSFVCSVKEPETGGGEETRTGGWRNCILQLGYNYFLTSPDVSAARSGVTSLSMTISGTDLTADGDYVCEVNIASRTAAIMLKSSVTNVYPLDYERNVVYVDIGTVSDGVQVSGIPNHPVIYDYQ